MSTPSPPPPHGTRARYLEHVAGGQGQPCAACLRAEARDLHMTLSVMVANMQAARDRLAMLMRQLP
jgi:hypothetical protein